MAQLDWLAEDRLEVDGVPFWLMEGPQTSERSTTGLHLHKTRPLLEDITAIVEDLAPKRIFELGIYQGGSVALLKLLTNAQRHVAIDIETQVPELESWLAEHDPTRTVRTYYGVDQSDSDRLRSIVDRDFDGQPLDLVIDDASHRFEETRVSFNTLFPYLREGGLYIVEDWSWVHLYESAIRAAPGFVDDSDQPPDDSPTAAELAAPSPARLLIEQLIACAGPLGIVEELRVDRYLAVIRRGSAELDPRTFDVGSCYGNIGRALTGVNAGGRTAEAT